MATEVGPDQIQARIQAARREAETLKERIRCRREELADTTCTCAAMSSGRVRRRLGQDRACSLTSPGGHMQVVRLPPQG